MLASLKEGLPLTIREVLLIGEFKDITDPTPGVTRDRLYIEAMQQIFSSTTKVMVDTKSNNSMIYLPLDKLIAQTSAEAAAALQQAPAASTDGAVSAPESPRLPEPRGRDSRNIRDRETR